MSRPKIAVRDSALAEILVAVLAASLPGCTSQTVSLKGAIIRQDSDQMKQSPIADVAITADDGLAPVSTKSDSSGLFNVTLRQGLLRDQPITLRFRHAGYQPLDLNQSL